MEMTERFLQWSDDEGRAQRFALEGAEISIGRRPGSTLRLYAGTISGEHAKIVGEGDDLYIVDLDSTNGTFLNEEPVTRARLRSGDRLRLGQLEMRYWVESPESARIPAEDEPAPEGPRRTFQDMDLTSMVASASTAISAPESELEKMSFLLDLQVQWGQQFSSEAMFQQILRSALQISGAERGFILLREEDDFEYAAGLDAKLNLLAEERFQTSRSVVEKVVREGQPVFMTEGIQGDLAEQESIVAMNLRAIACLPLTRLGGDGMSGDAASDGAASDGAASDDATSGAEAPQEVMGILYLDSTKAMHALSGLDERILRKLAVEAGNVLEKVEMIRDIEEKKALERELALAHETQVGLLPRRLPEIEGLRIRACNRPTRTVSGDFYDFIEAPGQPLVAVLADVSGKGVAAALLGSSLQGALQTLLRSGLDPKEALDAANAYVCERSEEHRFVTLFLLTLDPDGDGIYLNAGHVPAYLYRAATGQIDELAAGDLILGMFDDVSYQRKPLHLDEGDTLLVYSDGLTDASNADDEMFGEERLRALVRELGGEGAERLEAGILQALEAFASGVEQTDDITFVVIERRTGRLSS